MSKLSVVVRVEKDGTISGKAPLGVLPGEHKVEFELRQGKQRPKLADLPIHDSGPWPEGLTFRREDIYGESGR